MATDIQQQKTGTLLLSKWERMTLRCLSSKSPTLSNVSKGLPQFTSCPCGTQTHAGATQLGRKLGLLVDTWLNTSQWCDLEANGVLGYGQQVESAVPSAGLSSTKETGTDWREPNEGPQGWQRDWSTWKRADSGGLINVHKYLKGKCRDEGASLSSVVPSDKTRRNGHKLEHRRFPFNIRKPFFPMSTGTGCPGRSCRLPPSWRYSNTAWTCLWAACSGWPCLSNGLEQMSSKGSFQPQPVCDSVKRPMEKPKPTRWQCQRH